MKKIVLLLFALTLVAAGYAFAGVSGTPHDLSAAGALQICVGCHTPHAAIASTNGPLWNRNQAAQTYNLYTNPEDSATFDMTSTNVGPQSIACLTCHNGVASTLINYPGPDSVQNANYDSTAFSLSTYSNIGTDLSNDHPVGFTYNNAADLQNNGFPTLQGNNLISSNMFAFDNSVGSDQFECATCHDVHNQSVPTRQPVYFLRFNNNGSNMCAACHGNKI